MSTHAQARTRTRTLLIVTAAQREAANAVAVQVAGPYAQNTFSVPYYAGQVQSAKPTHYVACWNMPNVQVSEFRKRMAAEIGGSYHHRRASQPTRPTQIKSPHPIERIAHDHRIAQPDGQLISRFRHWPEANTAAEVELTAPAAGRRCKIEEILFGYSLPVATGEVRQWPAD